MLNLTDMIYSFKIEDFPEGDKVKECNYYQDQNDFVWKIARVENGFFVGYFGDDYFKDKYFDLIVNGENKLIMNSGCFFIQDTDFDTFYEFRVILSLGFTDEIWDSIGEFITERLTHDNGLTECEIVN